MRVERKFQPLTIHIDYKEEAEILEEALLCLVKQITQKGGSWWAGWKTQQLTPEQIHYRTQVNKLLFALNPEHKSRPTFMTEWA